jgi:transcriptional regulator with XRE-family HTH domain
MSGESLKRLRERKSWSQAHLAQAAGLNVRTVQRIEAGEPCSYETMLSLAAALDVAVPQLELEPRQSDHEYAPSAGRIVAATIAIMPAALFVTVNLLRSPLGIAAPFDFLASTGAKLMTFETFNRVSPVLFFGGAAVALAISLPALLRVRGKLEHGALVLSAVELRARRVPLLLSVAALLIALTLLAYVALEQFRTAIS